MKILCRSVNKPNIYLSLNHNNMSVFTKVNEMNVEVGVQLLPGKRSTEDFAILQYLLFEKLDILCVFPD